MNCSTRDMLIAVAVEGNNDAPVDRVASNTRKRNPYETSRIVSSAGARKGAKQAINNIICIEGAISS